jgi:hypothetical protein
MFFSAFGDFKRDAVSSDQLSPSNGNDVKEANDHSRTLDQAYNALNDGVDGAPIEVLSLSDWKRAVMVAFEVRVSDIPVESYKSAFAEVSE